MKQRMMFMVINMNVGGTEKALLNLIAELPKEQYDITIYMLEKQGDFLHDIPSHVHVDYVKGYRMIKPLVTDSPKNVIKKLVKNRQFVKAWKMLFLYVFVKVKNDRRIFFKSILKQQQALTTKYDVAVAYAGPMDLISFFVAQKIKAKKKIQWIHFDVTKISFDRHFNNELYKQFDHVYTVSREAKEKLVDILPSIKRKIDVCPNLVSPHLIKSLAEKGKKLASYQKEVNILTVGRLSVEKGQDLAIKAMAKLVERGHHVKWYCVGEGKAKQYYETLIQQYGLEDKFILLGLDTNPYSYMKQCDIYVQPSRHEGYCITLAEAKVFKRLIVTTNFTGAKEQIRHRETGLIVGADDREIYLAVEELLQNECLRSTIFDHLENEQVDQSFDVNQYFLDTING
ncbi:glycosyltransferase [Evansella halocellulosilytica]|uniref:glycosyltransferase n=1 Tax=Evansella halocellulosilytica TaxID=2011013 RepID=UPI000BB942B9|nr:glycosyltransferase [Evansella halocellulosilytica]